MLCALITYFYIPNLEMCNSKKVLLIFTIFPLISFFTNLLLLTDSPRNQILTKQMDKSFDILKSVNKGIKLTNEIKQNVIIEVMTQPNLCTSGSIFYLFTI